MIPCSLKRRKLRIVAADDDLVGAVDNPYAALVLDLMKVGVENTEDFGRRRRDRGCDAKFAQMIVSPALRAVFRKTAPE